MKADNENKINCFKCIYFAVTWEPKLPRACKLFGFKSACMPSVTVFNATGTECQGFAAKDEKRK